MDRRTGRPGWVLRRLAAAAVFALAIAACAPKTAVQKSGEDQEIARDISWEMRKNPRLEGVIVFCMDRTITLTGRVDREADSNTAYNIALSHGRGAPVVNRLEIRPR